LIGNHPKPKEEELFSEDIRVFRELLQNNPNAFPSWEVFKMTLSGCVEWVKFTRTACKAKLGETMEMRINTRYTMTGWIGTFEDFEVEVMRRSE
jgi:hypothetical protein